MKTQRGAALLAAMITVALVATLAAAALWRQWRGVEVEGAERVARFAAENGITNFTHVSAIGADAEPQQVHRERNGRIDEAQNRDRRRTQPLERAIHQHIHHRRVHQPQSGNADQRLR